MKKALAILLALAVVLSLSVTAFAAGPESEAGSASRQASGIFGQGQVPGGRPGMGGQPPMTDGQAPDGEATADLPERPDMGLSLIHI